MKCNLVNENFTSDYAKNLFASHGIKDIDEYRNPSEKYLESPLALKNMKLGMVLYKRVMEKENPKILIVVDSDTDGYTSAAIMYQYTQRLNPNSKINYLLHEGKQHGLQDHIDKLMETDESYDLIILPDSSSNDAHYHDMLEEIHLPCLILDHHLTDVALSDNAVVINNQLSPEYTNKELTGAGVVYQFCRYLDSVMGHNWADDYIDLAALGIIGDMGSVVEMENRFIINKGLHNVKNPFFKAIAEKQGYSISGSSTASFEEIMEKLNPISIAFYIVPLINAVVRAGSMEEKDMMFRAFIEGDKMIPSTKRGANGALEHLAVEMARIGGNIRVRQNKVKETAVERIETKIFKYDLLDNKVLFIRLDEDDNFPPELNGLVAMQLSAKYKKPTIVARLNSEGFDRGSARGLNDSELKDFKQFLVNSGLFEYAQGHANAFGVSMPDRNYYDFLEYANKELANVNFGENAYDVNFERCGKANDLGDIISDLHTADGLWGQGNPEPLIHVTNITIQPGEFTVMGQKKDTVKFEYNGVTYIKFKANDLIQELRGYEEPMSIEIVGKPNLNIWGGRVTPQIMIEDIDISDHVENEMFAF